MVLSQIPDLKLLWEMIEEKSEAVNRLCCSCLLQLVFDGHAEFDYVLSGLLNAIPSARFISNLCTIFISQILFGVNHPVISGIYKSLKNFLLTVTVYSSSGILVSKRRWLALGIWAGSCMTV